MTCHNLNTRENGFTLIELLVVIAIIGVMSSTILASLNSARGKAANAAVKANMQSLRKEAELYYDTVGNGSYGSVGTTFSGNCPTAGSNAGFMFNDPGYTKIRSMILATQAAANTSFTLKCISLPTSGGANYYIISAPLNVVENGNSWWCIDSYGASKGHPSAITSATTGGCP